MRGVDFMLIQATTGLLGIGRSVLPFRSLTVTWDAEQSARLESARIAVLAVLMTP
jgi:hypothetical protein